MFLFSMFLFYLFFTNKTFIKSHHESLFLRFYFLLLEEMYPLSQINFTTSFFFLHILREYAYVECKNILIFFFIMCCFKHD